MRTAHIITRLIIGGAQENTLWTVDDQHHLHGDEVCLITGPGLGPEGSLEPRAIQRELDLRIVPEMHRSLHPLRDVQCYRALKRLLAEYRPDIVHTHSSKAGILGRRAAWALGIPCVHTIHGASFHYGQPAPLYHAYRLAEKTAEPWCQHLISVCDAMSRQYLTAGIGRPEKYTTIYSGMDVNCFLHPNRSRRQVRQALGIADTDIVVGKVARLFNLKGHEYVLAAAPAIVAACPNVRFLFLGDGVLRDQFEQQIANAGLTHHFIFAGLVPPDEVGEYIHAMDILTHTSDWEGLARVLPQALICGKPVVSFDNDGAPEVCITGETGILVKSRDVEGLTNAIIQLSNDEDLRHKLGATGRDRFTEVFRHEYMTEQIRKVYQAVLTPS